MTHATLLIAALAIIACVASDFAQEFVGMVGFVDPEMDTRVANATLAQTSASSASACASKCTVFNSTTCVAFSYSQSTGGCELSTYGPHYATEPAIGWTYYRRVQLRDQAPVKLIQPPHLQSPVRGV